MAYCLKSHRYSLDFVSLSVVMDIMQNDVTPDKQTVEVQHVRLSELKTSQVGLITKVFGHGSFRNRITEMGFIRGKIVKVIKNAPLLDPVEYEIMGYRIALRRSEAELIEVMPLDALPHLTLDAHATGHTHVHPRHHAFQRPKSSLHDWFKQFIASLSNKKKENTHTFTHKTLSDWSNLGAGSHLINVALVGNPNCGKTSLFNLASGSHERVGNYSGVTVDAKTARFRQGNYTFDLVDLPGTYSITEYTPEELYVRTHILQEMPDVVINVIDATNLERNLYLTTQLIDMDIKMVIALNMYDELESTGAKLDYRHLGSMLGIPIVPTVASVGKGIHELFETVIQVFEDKNPTVRHIHINYGPDLEEAISTLQTQIWENKDIVARYSSRYLAIKLLEGDKSTAELLEHCPNFEKIKQTQLQLQQKLTKQSGDEPEAAIADAKYGFIAGALKETFQGETRDKHERTSKIDHIMTSKIWGLPIFLLLMWITFQATFSLGAIPAGWIENGVSWLSDFVMRVMPAGALRNLIVDGIISGVGGVIVFLPNILILFFCISLMEDTGYMARAAFIMDKLMHKIGLHGKSFIPLLMGFGCNVPAIMATRTLESRKDRILTMLIIPFMSCSARLPVYVLLISAFFVQHKGLVLLSIYLLGIVVAILSSILFKRLFFRKEEAPFVMELPPYRVPTGRSVVRHMWNKGAQYLRKMGTIILVASVIVWALSHYPVGAPSLTPVQRQEQSYIGRIGKAIEPVLRPLGFDWQIGVSLVSGLAAKEIVVSTMAVLTGSGDNEATLSEKLQNQVYTQGDRVGEKVFTPLKAYTMMVFILLYFPCIAAITAIYKEAGRRWAIFTLLYTTGMAWIMSFIFYHIGSLLL